MSTAAVVEHFLETCSAHAYYKLTSHYKNKIRKAIWIFIIICSFVLFIYHFYTLAVKFISNPISTKIKYDFQTVTYPSITICYNMPFFIQNFSNPVPWFNSEMNFSVVDDLAIQFWNRYLYLIKVPYGDLFKIYFRSIMPLADKASVLVHPRIPFVKCFLDNEYDCRISFSKFFIYENRPCISGNVSQPKITSVKIAIFWPYSSLYPKNNNPFINYNTFLAVYLHPLRTYPNGLPLEAVKNQNFLNINYELSHNRLVCRDVFDDIKVLSILNDEVLTFTYSKSLCDQIATQRRIWMTCNCLSETLAIPSEFYGIIYNNVDNYCHAIWKGLVNASNGTISSIIERVKCHDTLINNMSYSCPQRCDYYDVSVFSQYSQLKTTAEVADNFLNLYNYLKSTNNTNKQQRQFFDSESYFQMINDLNLNNQTEAFLQIGIDYSPEVLMFESRKAFDKMGFLSEIGGIMGLYMGWSAITVIEILVFFVELIVYRFIAY